MSWHAATPNTAGASKQNTLLRSSALREQTRSVGKLH